MSLNAPVIPPVVLRAFTSGLANYVDPSRPLWSLLMKKYAVYSWWSLNLFEIGKLSPSDINDPNKPIKLQDFVQSTGWRFVATDGDLYGGCHVGSIKEDAPPILTGFSDDVQILTFMESLEDLNALPVVGTDQFELRGLSIRWLRVEVFWLHTTDGAADIVIPYTGFVEDWPNYLELMKPYRAEEFLNAILKRAKSICERENASKGVVLKAKAKAALAQALAHRTGAAALEAGGRGR